LHRYVTREALPHGVIQATVFN